MYYLEQDESVSQLEASGEVLGIGINYRERYQPGKSISELKKTASIVMLKDEESQPVRALLGEGSVRSVVGLPSGFALALASYDAGGRGKTDFLLVSFEGKVTALPSLPIDLVGMWEQCGESIYAYSARAVFCYTISESEWRELPLNPTVNNDAVRSIANTEDRMHLVVTDRLVKGFEDFADDPVFVKDLNSYPDPVHAYGDRIWWLTVSGDRTRSLRALSTDGQLKELQAPSNTNIHKLLFDEDRVYIVCSREGGNIHKYSYYVAEKENVAKMSGPYMLPDDTINVTLWNDAIISGGAANQVFKTELPQE